MDQTIEIKLYTVLLAALVAFILNLWKEAIVKGREEKKELSFLTIRVSCELERFANQCYAVATDHGYEDQEGYSRTNVNQPDFEPFEIDVNWKVLPARLMYQILELPNELHFARECIESVGINADSLPDYPLTFAERRYHYSKIAYNAFHYVNELRVLGDIPVKIYNEWSSPLRLIDIHKKACKDSNREVVDLEEILSKIQG